MISHLDIPVSSPADIALARQAALRFWPSDRLMHTHARMRDTRGASVAAMSADSVSGSVVFAGVGDPSARIVSVRLHVDARELSDGQYRCEPRPAKL